MLEPADARDLRMLALPPLVKPTTCPHCGSSDAKPLAYLWRSGNNSAFGCCEAALIATLGSEGRIIAQTAPSFVAD